MSFCSVICLLRWMTVQERVKLVQGLLTSNQFTFAGLSTVSCDYPLSYTVLPACCLAKADWEEMTVKKDGMASPAVHSTHSLSLEPASVMPASFLGGCLMVSSVPGASLQISSHSSPLRASLVRTLTLPQLSGLSSILEPWTRFH